MATEMIIEVKTKGTKKSVSDIDKVNDALGKTNDELEFSMLIPI